MKTNRRELLKFFSAGTLIAPLAGDAVAKLIEVPNAEIIKSEAVAIPYDLARVTRLTLTLESPQGIRTIHCDPSGARGEVLPGQDISVSVRAGGYEDGNSPLAWTFKAQLKAAGVA